MADANPAQDARVMGNGSVALGAANDLPEDDAKRYRAGSDAEGEDDEV